MALKSAPQSTIIQAKSQDTRVIAEFIDRASLVHRHLDWRPLMQWVDREPFLVKFEKGKIQGILSCAPDPEGIAWIHCFAAVSQLTYQETWMELFEVAKSHPALRECILCSV